MAFIDESTNEAEAKQMSPPPPSPPADQGGDGEGEDRISGLCDDVLVRILGLADMDARELVRTGVLSRRWRGLWTRVPSLYFMSPWPLGRPLELESAGDVGQHVAFVNSVLAQRARSEEASIDSLSISLFMLVEYLRGQRPNFVPPVVEAAEAWIRYAVQHHVRCFYLDLRLPFVGRQDLIDFKQEVQELLKRLMGSIDNPDEEPEADEQEDGEDEEEEEADEHEEKEAPDVDDGDGEEVEEDEKAADEQEETNEDQSDDDDQGNDDEEDKPVIDLGDLPSSTKLETLYFWLSQARVRLPSTAVFASLKTLTLEFMELAPGSGHLLARLSSSACCPSLQRLRIGHVRFRRPGTGDLVLDAGELLKLSLDGMDGMRSLELRTPNLLCLEITHCRELRALTVSAPALEELTFQHNSIGVAIHGDFPLVRRLKTHFLTHWCDDDDDDDINDASISLVNRCSSSVTSLLVYLHVPLLEEERHVDLIKDKIPHLPKVISLVVNIHPMCERHSFGDGVTGLLTRFKNLEYLTLQLDDFGLTKKDEYYSKDDDGDSVFTCNHADNWESNSSDISLGSLVEACFMGMTGTGCELRFLQMVLAGATGLERVTVNFSGNYNLQDSRVHYFLHTLRRDGTWTTIDDHDHLYEWTPCP